MKTYKSINKEISNIYKEAFSGIKNKYDAKCLKTAIHNLEDYLCAVSIDENILLKLHFTYKHKVPLINSYMIGFLITYIFESIISLAISLFEIDLPLLLSLSLMVLFILISSLLISKAFKMGTSTKDVYYNKKVVELIESKLKWM